MRRSLVLSNSVTYLVVGPFALLIIRSIADRTTNISGEGDWENLTFVGCLILDKPMPGYFYTGYWALQGLGDDFPFSP